MSVTKGWRTKRHVYLVQEILALWDIQAMWTKKISVMPQVALEFPFWSALVLEHQCCTPYVGLRSLYQTVCASQPEANHELLLACVSVVDAPFLLFCFFAGAIKGETNWSWVEWATSSEISSQKLALSNKKKCLKYWNTVLSCRWDCAVRYVLLYINVACTLIFLHVAADQPYRLATLTIRRLKKVHDCMSKRKSWKDHIDWTELTQSSKRPLKLEQHCACFRLPMDRSFITAKDTVLTIYLILTTIRIKSISLYIKVVQ